MKGRGGRRFGKWFCKVMLSYAVFIMIGLLFSSVPAARLGLTEAMFLNLRIFFMVFGPIYLTLLIKIILTIVKAVRDPGQDNGTAEKGRNVLFFVTALLLCLNLSEGKTISDFTTGYTQSKGLGVLENISACPKCWLCWYAPAFG